MEKIETFYNSLLILFFTVSLNFFLTKELNVYKVLLYFSILFQIYFLKIQFTKIKFFNFNPFSRIWNKFMSTSCNVNAKGKYNELNFKLLIKYKIFINTFNVISLEWILFSSTLMSFESFK